MKMNITRSARRRTAHIKIHTGHRPAPSTVHAPARLQHTADSTTLVEFTPGFHMYCMYGLRGQRAVVSRARELRSTCYSWHPVSYNFQPRIILRSRAFSCLVVAIIPTESLKPG